MKIRSLTFHVSFIFCFTLLSCQTEENEPDISDRNSVFFLVSDLMDLNNYENFKKQYGKPSKVEKINGYPCDSKKCIKVFSKDRNVELIFSDNKLIRITLYGLPNLTKEENPVRRLGLTAFEHSFSNPGTVITYKHIRDWSEISFYSDYILLIK